MRFQIVIIVASLALCAQICRGDEILLKNGDRISGKIQHLVDGKLTIKSDAAGTVTVDLSNIQTLSSDGPIEVNLKDKTGFTQKVSSAGPGQFAIEGDDLRHGCSFSFERLQHRGLELRSFGMFATCCNHMTVFKDDAD